MSVPEASDDQPQNLGRVQTGVHQRVEGSGKRGYRIQSVREAGFHGRYTVTALAYYGRLLQCRRWLDHESPIAAVRLLCTDNWM